MASTLETLSWIATIVAVPAIIGGWFFAAKRKTNKSVASRGATAISGDVHGGAASIVTGHNSPVSLVTVEADKQRAQLQFVCLRSTFDGSRSSWRIVIRNEGPAEAINLRVRLLHIEPRLKLDWNGYDFPYDVPRASVWDHAGWVRDEFNLNPASEELFQPFRSWRSSLGQLVVVGLDARNVHDLNGMAASIEDDESWCLTYEASAANAEAVKFHLRVYVKNGSVVAENMD